MLLENALDLYQRCFSKQKLPNTNQFLRLCEDLRQSIESLLLLGIGLSPQDESTFSENQRDKRKMLSDYIEKKLVAKVELDQHVIEKRVNPEVCRIFTKDLKRTMADVMSWNNGRKAEKNAALAQIFDKAQQNELTYICEIFLK